MPGITGLREIGVHACVCTLVDADAFVELGRGGIGVGKGRRGASRENFGVVATARSVS